MCKMLIFCLAGSALLAQVPILSNGGNAVGGSNNLTTVGAVPYVSAPGTLNQDPADFFWDATNNRLGIGTATPATSLQVAGGKILLDNAQAIQFKDSSGTARTILQVDSGDNVYLDSAAAGGDTFFRALGVDRMTIKSTSGRVGIGTTAPGYLLDVAKSSGSGTFRVYDQAATTGSTLAVFRAGVAQSTNDITQWQANDGTTILARVTSGGKVSSTLFGSETNCSSSAAPAVCAAAAAGSVIIPAAGTDVTVNTTAVTANSQIFAIFDQSLGTKLGVTCNSTTANPHIGARVAGTSFTIHANVSPVTNPACFSYFIIN